MGFTYKRAGSILGISAGTVSKHVTVIASKIPGNGKSGWKVAKWFDLYHDE